MKQLLFSFSFIFLLFACNKKANEVSGKFTNAPNLPVNLDQLYFNGTTNAVANSNTDANGAFNITTKEAITPGLYRLKIGNKAILLVVDPSDSNLRIEGDFMTMNTFDLKISGSKSSEIYSNFMKELIQKPKSNEDIEKIVKDAKSPMLAALMSFPVTAAPDSARIALMKSVKPALEKDFASTAYPTQFQMIIQQYENFLKGPEAKSNIAIGSPVPEIELPDPNGKIRKLSDLKGKVVLVDFWASWCGPCRRENPNVVAAYNKFKGKGFEVFSVSLDGVGDNDRARMTPAELEKGLAEGKRKWMDAIKQDKLPWENHVSDLKHWNCAPAQLYGVASIPSTFLLDKDGKVIAINPRQNLEKELEKVLGN